MQSLRAQPIARALAASTSSCARCARSATSIPVLLACARSELPDRNVRLRANAYHGLRSTSIPIPISSGRTYHSSAPSLAKSKSKGKGKSKSQGEENGSAAAPAASRYPPLPEGWQAVVGVETHAQLRTRRKLFSSAHTPPPSATPNTLVAPFDAAYPGTLPVLNQAALECALRASLALNCHVRHESRFDRKHYFYPDLPSGYQITQSYAPLAVEGKLSLRFEDGHLPSKEDEVDVRILQVQIEQDTAKSTHYETEGLPDHERTFVDLNRAGTGLMEIVSGPEMRSPEQAGAYVRKLQEVLRRVGASDGNMDEGSFRCDVNVSVNKIGEAFGTRCEIKNLNSVRFIMNAISHEIHRQVAMLERGEKVEQETRGYDEAAGTTFRLRSKEDAPDYRYMPDPNLPPVIITQERLERVRSALPELPDAMRARLQSQYGLSTRGINVLMRVGTEDERASSLSHDQQEPRNDKGESLDAAGLPAFVDAVEYFEQVANGRNAQSAMNWIINELLQGLNVRNLPFRANPVMPEHLGELIDLVEQGRVTGTTAKALLSELLAARANVLSSGSTSSSDASASASASPLAAYLSSSPSTPIFALLSARGYLRLGDPAALLPLCEEVVRDLPEEASKVRAGNGKVVMRLVGEVVRRAEGRADAKVAREVLDRLLLAPESAP